MIDSRFSDLMIQAPKVLIFGVGGGSFSDGAGVSPSAVPALCAKQCLFGSTADEDDGRQCR